MPDACWEQPLDVEGLHSTEKNSSMLGNKCCTEIDLATIGLDSVAVEMATWRMTTVEQSIYSEVCLGVFTLFFLWFPCDCFFEGIHGLRFHTLSQKCCLVD